MASEPAPEKQTNSKNPLKELAGQPRFLAIVIVCMVLSAAVTGQPQVAMWVGFCFAAYSAVANDSIQTIGTFIASNKQRPWWQLWAFIGGVFLITMTLSWMRFGGPVHIDIDGLVDEDGNTLSVDKEETVLQITMQAPGTDTVIYREMKLGIEAGSLTDRESLGIDIEQGLVVTAVEIGQCAPPSSWDGTNWITESTSDEEIACWDWDSQDGLPEGATSGPSLRQTYAAGSAPTEGHSWTMQQGDTSVGTIEIDETTGGDVSNQRLFAKGFDTQVNDFQFLQLAAPLFLILFTRLRMPVSTTFLLLSCFAASGKTIGSVAIKSMSGYLIAFVCSILLWGILGKAMNRWFTGPANPLWRVAQWITTGCLWSVWLMQDAANIAVYLPRSLTFAEFLVFAGVIFCGLGALFRMGGEKIQEVVNEKSKVVDVRAATILDLLYSIILYIFKFASNIPMSTTWVFVGLLAGRELAMTRAGVGEEGRTMKEASGMVIRDLVYVTIGFAVSLILAAIINPAVRESLFSN